jgi:hypothetical protein
MTIDIEIMYFYVNILLIMVLLGLIFLGTAVANTLSSIYLSILMKFFPNEQKLEPLI